MTEQLFFTKEKEDSILFKVNKSENDFIIIFESQDFDLLEKFSDKIHMNKDKRSIVFVYLRIPEKLQNTFTINIVPSIKEAEDFIEMEKIERTLNLE